MEKFLLFPSIPKEDKTGIKRKMTIDLKIGDKMYNISSMKTYEKVIEIKIVDSKPIVVTKEYYQNTHSLVSDRTIEWTIDTIKKHKENMPVRIVKE